MGDNTALIGRVGPILVEFEACVILGTFFRRSEFFFFKIGTGPWEEAS